MSLQGRFLQYQKMVATVEGMPSRNRVKDYAPDSYYHIYNRGVNKRKIFRDEKDYAVFLSILKRHLSDKPITDGYGRTYDIFGDSIELLAYCLMPNHFHMFIHQGEDWRSIELFMRKVITAYAMYFNRRYKRVGPLFQDRYKASRIDNDAYLEHITRYIHLNPHNYKQYEWSSFKDYIGQKHTEWVKPGRIMQHFGSVDAYVTFVDDLSDYMNSMDTLSLYLAHE